jgi:hypothetical protein
MNEHLVIKSGTRRIHHQKRNREKLRQQKAHRMQRSTEGVEDKTQVLQRHHTKQRSISGFAKNHGAMPFANLERDVAFGYEPFNA